MSLFISSKKNYGIKHESIYKKTSVVRGISGSGLGACWAFDPLSHAMADACDRGENKIDTTFIT